MILPASRSVFYVLSLVFWSSVKGNVTCTKLGRRCSTLPNFSGSRWSTLRGAVRTGPLTGAPAGLNNFSMSTDFIFKYYLSCSLMQEFFVILLQRLFRQLPIAILQKIAMS